MKSRFWIDLAYLALFAATGSVLLPHAARQASPAPAPGAVAGPADSGAMPVVARLAPLADETRGRRK